MLWQPTLFSRLGWGFRLFRRTIVVQLVVGLASITLSTPGGLLAPAAPALGVFIMAALSLMLVPWMLQTLMAAFAHSMAEDASPPLVATLLDGWGRLPVMGNAMLLLILISIPLIFGIALLGMIHPLVSLLGIVVFYWVSLRLFTLAGVVSMENIGPWQAIKRGWQLSAGFVLRMLGNALFLALVFVLLGLVVGGIAWFAGLAGVASQLAAAGQIAAGGATPDLLLQLMNLGTTALFSLGILIVGALLLNMLMMALMVAYSFFFCVEQKMEHDGSKPGWQPVGMAERKQWTTYLGLVVVIALLPTLAVAFAPTQVNVSDPVVSETMKHPSTASQQEAVKVAPAKAPAVQQKANKVESAKAVTKPITAGKVKKGKAAAESVLPESEKHRVKAPVVDIASLRDPFESYLKVLERQSKERLEANRPRESDRTREPLEAFDLTTLKLVAIMQMGEMHAAMVEDNEGRGYVVRKGSYIGRDNGRVVEITARDVVIMEDEYNAAGELVKRKAQLTLNEVNK